MHHSGSFVPREREGASVARSRRVGKAKRAHRPNDAASKWWARRKSAFAHLRLPAWTGCMKFKSDAQLPPHASVHSSALAPASARTRASSAASSSPMPE